MLADNSSTSLSSILSPTTVFRVRRKRTADPHEALVISLKRAKQASASGEVVVNEPIICLRRTATDLRYGLEAGNDTQKINVIDVNPQLDDMGAMEEQPINAENSNNEISASSNNILELLQNAPEEAASSSMIVGEVTIKPSQITVNGIPMAVLNNQDDEEFIFDYYWSCKADGCTAHQIRDVRLANADDLMLFDGEDTESSVEDDDDSNDENNWRNDYPDESEHTSGCGSDEDSSSESVSDYDDLERHMGDLDFSNGEDSLDDYGDYDDS